MPLAVRLVVGVDGQQPGELALRAGVGLERDGVVPGDLAQPGRQVGDDLADALGLVGRGERVQLGRSVAVKFLHPWIAAQKTFLSRFENEAKAMSRLLHPHCVSVIDFATRTVVANWPIPGGGSPDMGNVSADGRHLWLSGRFDGVVYRFDTATGSVDKVAVGTQPHGLTVWPQPGRYSLGHTGVMR